MLKSERAIFREKALRHYMRSREETILPRFLSPQVIILLGACLGFC